jgi:hypothetical protein
VTSFSGVFIQQKQKNAKQLVVGGTKVSELQSTNLWFQQCHD